MLKLKPLLAKEAQEKKRSGRAVPPMEDCKSFYDGPIGGRTFQRLGEKVCLSHATIAKAEFISRQADEQTKERLRRGETSIHAEYVRLRRHGDSLLGNEQTGAMSHQFSRTHAAPGRCP